MNKILYPKLRDLTLFSLIGEIRFESERNDVAQMDLIYIKSSFVFS